MRSAVALAIPILVASFAHADVTPRRLDGHKGGVIAVAFHPEGKVLASGGKDQTIVLWDPATGKATASWPAHKGEVNWLTFSPDGKTLASAAKDGTVCLWDPETKKNRATIVTRSSGWSRFAFTPDSKTLVVSTLGGTTRFVDVASGKETLEHRFYGVCIAISPDGSSLVLGTGGGEGGAGSSMRLVKPAMKGDKPQRVTRTFESGVDALAFHPEGKLVAAGYYNIGAVKLWEVETGRLDATIKASGHVFAVAFSRDGKTLAFTHGGGALDCWDMGAKRQSTLRVADRMYQVAFHPDGKILAAAGDRAVWLLDVAETGVAELRKPKSEIRIEGPVGIADGVVDLTVSPSGKTLCWRSAQALGWQRLDEKSDGSRVELGHKSWLWNHAIVFDKDENLIVASFLEVEPRPVRPFPGPRFGPIRHIRGETSFSPDRKIFAVGGSDVEFSRIDVKAKKLTSLKDPKATPTEPLPLDAVRMWGVESGKEEERLEGHKEAVVCAAFAPDGKRIASLGVDGEVRVWDLDTNKTTSKFLMAVGLPPHFGQPELAFVDNRVLAGSFAETITLWDVVAGKEIGRLESPTTQFARIAASRDGKLLAAASVHGEIQVWDVASLKRVAAFRAAEPRPRPGSLSALAFSPDGKTLFAGGTGMTIALWDLEAMLAPDRR